MTIHRALGYVDRASMRDGAPLRVVMCSEGQKGDGIDLRMSGARLERFRTNPVLGYGHSYWGRGNLPIGRILAESITVEGQLMYGEPDFDQGDEFAREVERKMRDGYLNAVSIGFDVLRWEDPKSNYWTGGVAVEWELTELSVVPIGMDEKALVTSRGLADPQLLDAVRACSAQEFDELLRRMGALRGVLDTDRPAAPVAEDPAPAVPAVNQDAARDLLAAFNL